MPFEDDTAHIAFADATRLLASSRKPFVELWEQRDLTVELFAPRIVDNQEPHTRDEIYLIIAGKGIFRRADTTIEFGPGDFLYVPAHMPHRFERFSADFQTWVIFWGPTKPFRST
jgi:mannose-6-phosphate isomerase-like protein (cupin superfamily)